MAIKGESIEAPMSWTERKLLLKDLDPTTPTWKLIKSATKKDDGVYTIQCEIKRVPEILKGLRLKTGTNTLVYKILMAKLTAKRNLRKSH